MNAGSSRGFLRKSVTPHDKKIFEQPENIGNRKTFDEIKVPPDNVGNKIDRDPIATFVHDGLGNSLDDEPSHLKSGILPYPLGQKTRPVKRVMREKILVNANGDDQDFGILETVMTKTEKVVKIRTIPRPSIEKKKWPGIQLSTVSEGRDDFRADLASFFKKNLEEKVGSPFSFSLKTVENDDVDKAVLLTGLNALKILIEEIFKMTSIDAQVSYLQYATDHHRFAIFFINPVEKDPVKNKDLISALRHVVNLHVEQFISPEINVFLVLANAKNVIEGHLTKIGALTIEDD